MGQSKCHFTCIYLSPSISHVPPLSLSLSVGIKERLRHQRPVTTEVNGASHMHSHTHRHEKQVLQLEMGAFGDLEWGY